jgi:NTP pyrophosphatase (non-canonical NTP hydrolase)
MKNLNELAKEVHQNAVDHGWWENDRGFGEIIALCHSELSEALEEYRNNMPVAYYFDDEHCIDENIENAEGRKLEGTGVELADCIIRILDYCGKENIDMQRLVELKHEYNKSRPYKHGGKVI